MANLYFELTREFNADGVVAVLSSGQAVVYYRLAIMSKDGEWIVREDAAACARVTDAAVASLFSRDWSRELPVLDLPSLIATKQTQRAKDYPIVGALSRLLPPGEELEFTTDPDRVIELAARHGAGSRRPAVLVAGQGRDAVVVALAREIDQRQQLDRQRLLRHQVVGTDYMREFLQLGLGSMPLPAAHERVVALAERLLPQHVEEV